ncbi:MAG: lytic transglycosylase domain-containing protein [Candidatus Margulisiibacteriota bacterium]
MDSTVVIVLLFVFTIFSSLGGNQGYKQPTSPQVVVTPLPIVSTEPGSIGAISPTYTGSISSDTKKSIEQYILGFRKPEEAVAITDAIIQHSKQYDVNPKLVAALMRRESGFNPRAISSSGALGLGQLLPSTCKTTGVTSPYDIDDNSKGTVRYMKYLLDKFKSYGDTVSFALAGYLEGPNAVARKKGYTSTTAGYVQDIINIYHKI